MEPKDFTKQKLLHYLKKHALGCDNAVTGKFIYEALGIPTVVLRQLKHELIVEDGELIGATSKHGYFYIENKAELEHCLAEMKSRVKEIQKVIGAYDNAWHKKRGSVLF